MDAFNYEQLNAYFGTRSVTGRVENDYTTSYFMRSLYQRVTSRFKFNIPDTWNIYYFKNVLFKNGYIGVINYDEFGIIPQICTFTGYGLYYEPKEMIVAQKLVNFRGTIGENCEIIKLTPDYRGIWDIIEHYAVQLSTAHTSLQVALENSRMAAIMAAKNKAAAEALKVIAEKISAGESLIVVDKILKGDDLTNNDAIWSLLFNVKENYIANMILADMETILYNFDKEVGIVNIDQKRERMITGEVEALTAGTRARLDTWLECLDDTFSKVNRLFPSLNISYELRGGEYNDN